MNSKDMKAHIRDIERIVFDYYQDEKSEKKKQSSPVVYYEPGFIIDGRTYCRTIRITQDDDLIILSEPQLRKLVKELQQVLQSLEAKGQ